MKGADMWDTVVSSVTSLFLHAGRGLGPDADASPIPLVRGSSGGVEDMGVPGRSIELDVVAFVETRRVPVKTGLLTS